MYQRIDVLLGVLAVSVITVACGPTDAELTAKVKTNLSADETVKASPIEVGVKKKVVTLSGAADSSTVKERAVAVARQTTGVADVVDRITVKDQGSNGEPGPALGREMMEKGMKMDDKNHPDKATHE